MFILRLAMDDNKNKDNMNYLLPVLSSEMCFVLESCKF